MHVSGRGRGIAELDLGAVFASDEERSALSLVKSLDLSHNVLTVVSALHPLGSLQTLNIAHNRIATLRSLPLTLTNVDLSFNQLTTLEGLMGLPCLEVLDVSHNKLHSLASMAGQPPTLQVLRASANRIASTDGIQNLFNLKVLLLDHNLVASSDALICLKGLEQLEVVSFAHCPVASVNGYRDYVIRTQPTLLSVDGAPTLGHMTRPLSRGLDSHNTSRRLNESTTTTQPPDAQDGYATLNATNQESTLLHSEERALRRELQDAVLLLEQEQKDHHRTRLQLRKSETQLQESKRLIREQLEELSLLRQEKESHISQLQALKGKVDVLQRNAKYEKERHHTETMRLAETFERDRTQHDVHISDLRQRIADVSSINSSRVYNAATTSRRGAKAASTHPHNTSAQSHRTSATSKGPIPRHMNTSKISSSATHPDDDDDDDTSEAAGALARQLKGWLCDEVRRQSKHDDRNRDDRDSNVSNSTEDSDDANSPRTAARNITALWERNEGRLGKR
ncbi:Hypothetical protein, putative [Bodo saltans]|uniref:Leucine-rich repeat protein n=1 Tax=Bodo saltans TaxID=75058 RepID=A0A0S4JD31_BODSA|nr:Hypothetical protein, putative [Bodo saltans]|eukprot:CUG89464.1 Hypothetical protein, putative [Bodo saltans]